MPDYCNEDDSKQIESVTMHGVHKVHPNDVGLDVASLKIIELSKKIRELNAALVSERNRCNNLCQVVRKLESESASLSNKDVICSLCKQNKITTNEKIDNTSESAGQEKKIKKMESVVLELRQKVQTLNHDLLLAKKVVEAETGEIIPNINTWLTNLKLKTEGTYGTWRGRQQQITALKNRIAKLQSQLALKASSCTEVLINKDNIENETFSGATFFGINYFQDDDNNLDLQSPKVNHTIEQNENKISTIIQLQDEKKRLEEDNDVTKKNLQKTKLRINNLLQEQKELKQQILFLIKKGKHDDELVESLVHRNEDLQNELNRMNQINKEKDDEIEKFNEQQSNLKQRKDIEIKRLEEIIIEKNQLIDNMNERLTTVNQIHLDKSEHEVITETNDIIQSNFIHSSQCDQLCDPDHIKSLTIERDGLVKLIENMESRIEELVNEKMKLELENTELTRKLAGKTIINNQSLLINEKSIKSIINNHNDNEDDQLFHYLTNENYIKNLFLKCSSLSLSSMKIITKYIKQFQMILIKYHNELMNLKNNIKLILNYRNDDFKLMMNIIDELRQQQQQQGQQRQRQQEQQEQEQQQRQQQQKQGQQRQRQQEQQEQEQQQRQQQQKQGQQRQRQQEQQEQEQQ